MNQIAPEPDRFFGYGSLVNLATHSYPNAQPRCVQGWARAWVHRRGGTYATLTAVPDPDSEIQGVTADVPHGDWRALDLREAAYARKSLPCGTAIYAVEPQTCMQGPERLPILLSYLDVVIQGYEQQFGPGAGAQFIRTTRGWDTPVLNDRAAPLYPRAQDLSTVETAVVDSALVTLGCEIQPL